MMMKEEVEIMAPLENLLPTLLQIFLTMGLGWVAGSLKMFGQKEARGLGMFVGKFSLPALIFISLASLNLSNIKWSFLLSILLSKSIIFIFVLLVDSFLNKNFSRAAIFAIYSTQTNDFGMGLPILNSVFGPGHPLVGLIYLVAPISLLILNPIGFVILEVGKNKNGETIGPFECLLRVLRGLVINPVVAMTILGVLANFAFSSTPPPHLTKFLSALGAAFSALAPFSLGLSMAGKLGGIRGDIIKPIAALVTMKTIVAPLLTYIIMGKVTTLLNGTPDPSLSNFALLLGSFPTALGVLSYAVEYNVSPNLVSAAIVLGTLASAPLMYGIATILTTLSESPESLSMADHSWIDFILSIASCIIILSLFLTQAKYRQAPHFLTTALLLIILFSSIVGLLAIYIPIPALTLVHLTALHASRLSTPCLALHLLLLVRSTTILSSPLVTLFLLIIGPLLSLATLLLLLSPYSPSRHAFGISQDYLSLAINSVALLPTLICFLLLTKLSHTSLPSRQMFRHSLLLLFLVTAMFASMAASLSRICLTGNTVPGAFKVIICLNKIMSSGQGLIFLAVFGVDQVGQMFTQLHKLVESLLSSGRQKGGVETFVMAITDTFIMTNSFSGSEVKNEEIGLEDLALEDKYLTFEDEEEQQEKVNISGDLCDTDKRDQRIGRSV